MAYPEYLGKIDKIHPTGTGIYGGDGSNFRPVKVDSDGHLQVDALSVVVSSDTITRTVLNFATLNVNTTAVGLANSIPALPAGANRAFITVETDQIRFTTDGTTGATSSQGHLLNPGDTLQFIGKNYRNVLTNISFNCVTTNAKIKISYLD